MWVTLGRQLLADGVRADSISADQGVPAREAAVEKFRAGDAWVLVATGACACLQPCKAYTYPMSGLPPSARRMWLRSGIVCSAPGGGRAISHLGDLGYAKFVCVASSASVHLSLSSHICTSCLFSLARCAAAPLITPSFV